MAEGDQLAPGRLNHWLVAVLPMFGMNMRISVSESLGNSAVVGLGQAGDFAWRAGFGNRGFSIMRMARPAVRPGRTVISDHCQILPFQDGKGP
jgi:hypothetical protein